MGEPGENSPTFASIILEDQQFVDESIVFSSWTIKTEVGGGSVYDHELDPYPSAIHYVKVSPAYFGSRSLKFAAYFLLPLLVTYYVATKKKSVNDKVDRYLVLNPSAMTFCPKPFEIVKRKVRGNGSFWGLRKQRPNENDFLHDYEYGNDRHVENFQAQILNSRSTNSRLSDIINNWQRALLWERESQRI